MTLTQLARDLGMKDASALRHAIRRGTLAAALVGKTYVVTTDEAERYAREHRGRRGNYDHRTARRKQGREEGKEDEG